MRPRLAATMLLAVSVILLAVWCGLFSGNPAEGPPQAVTSPHRGRAGKSVDGDSKQDLADRPEDRTGSNPLVTAERSAEVGSFEEDATSGLPAPFISFEELDPKDRELVKGDPAEAILFEAHDGMWGQLVAYRKIPEPPGWELAELTDEEYRFALELAERRNSLREAQDFWADELARLGEVRVFPAGTPDSEIGAYRASLSGPDGGGSSLRELSDGSVAVVPAVQLHAIPEIVGIREDIAKLDTFFRERGFDRLSSWWWLHSSQ